MSLVLLTLIGALSAAPEASHVQIIAHRGASHDAPENTVASVQLAWKQQADGSEFDVYLTKDGKIVAMHDATVKRTTGVDGKVAEMTVAELRALDAGKWKDPRFAGEPVPTIEEVLATAPAGKRVFIEVKSGVEIVPELVRVLKETKLKPEQLVIIAFSSDVVAAMKKERPDLKAYWLVSLKKKDQPAPTAASLIQKAKAINADGLNLQAAADVLNAAYGKEILDSGLELYAWTVNDVEVARAMVAAGVMGITTDRPAWLREQLAQPAK